MKEGGEKHVVPQNDDRDLKHYVKIAYASGFAGRLILSD